MRTRSRAQASEPHRRTITFQSSFAQAKLACVNDGSERTDTSAPTEEPASATPHKRVIPLSTLEDGIRNLQGVADELRRLSAQSALSSRVAAEAVQQTFLHHVLEIFGPDSFQYQHLLQFPLLKPSDWMFWADVLEGIGLAHENERRMDDAYQSALHRAITTVGQMRRSLEKRRQGLVASVSVAAEQQLSVARRLERIFDSFHRVAVMLRTRRSPRAAVTIADEHDVQYVLHALLLGDFADVRPEEHTPSHAGGSARADFLLKNERAVIETKMMRSSLNDRELGDELLADIGRYRKHPDFDAFYCFIYDPEHRLANPTALKADLEQGDPDFVRVFVRPPRQ